MTIYKPEGFSPRNSIDYFYTGDCDGTNIAVYLRRSNRLGGGFESWGIDKEYALQAVCQAYLGDVKDRELVGKERVLAELAGYELEYLSGSPDKPGGIKDYWFDPTTPVRVKQPDETVEVSKSRLAELEALEKEVKKLGGCE